MSSLIYLTLLLVLGTAECSFLTLTPTPTKIARNGTHNLTLTCSVNAENGSLTEKSAVDVVKMRILKFVNDEWKLVIDMEKCWKLPNVFDGLEGSASTDERKVSHLQVTWSLATDEISGQYMCDVIGYTRSQEAIVQRSPSVFLDVEGPLTMYQLFAIFKTFNNKLEKTFTKISTIEENLDQNQKTVDTPSGIYFEQWPQGVYGLLQAESGCPADMGVTWKTGHRTHNTQSQGTNQDAVSSPAHMKKPIMWTDGSSKLMRQYFCTVDNQTSGGLREWPAGSYCFNRYKESDCPLGFKIGEIYWDDEDTMNRNNYSGLIPGSYVGTGTIFYYCCRGDSSPQTPIQLPRRRPFYLYRYGGACQEVVGMEVTPEFMYFDTESASAYENFAPDGADSIPGVTLHNVLL